MWKRSKKKALPFRSHKTTSFVCHTCNDLSWYSDRVYELKLNHLPFLSFLPISLSRNSTNVKIFPTSGGTSERVPAAGAGALFLLRLYSICLCIALFFSSGYAYGYGIGFKFESICQLRMKDMVSICRRKRKQPNWIHDTLWEEMTAYWDTPAAKKKSETASVARLSERNGLGPHKHNTGQKSFQQIEYEMVSCFCSFHKS